MAEASQARVTDERAHVLRIGPPGSLHTCARFVGSREALLARGLITPRTVLPAKPCGCVSNQVRGEIEDRDGLLEEKVSMLGDGRLRVSLSGSLAAFRDREFQRFMRRVYAKEQPGTARPNDPRHSHDDDEDDDDWPPT